MLIERNENNEYHDTKINNKNKNEDTCIITKYLE